MFGMIGKNPKLKKRAVASSSAVFLPRVGPFSNLAAVDVSTLSDVTYSTGTDVVSSRTSPIKANTLTIDVGIIMTSTTYAQWYWANTVVLNGQLSCNGNNGTDGVILPGCVPIPIGGSGGSGASGGGGGAASSADSQTALGGSGGSGYAGDPGEISPSCTEVAQPGIGGSGYGISYNNTNPFILPSGGNGETQGCGGANPGLGQPGYGGAGPGGSILNTGGAGSGFASGGGGAGGGLVVIVCRRLVGGTGLVQCNGGSFGNDVNGNCGPNFLFAGSGGGGVAALFAIQYDGGLSAPQVSGGSPHCCVGGGDPGNYAFYEINKAGTAIVATHLNSNPSWNNL